MSDRAHRLQELNDLHNSLLNTAKETFCPALRWAMDKLGCPDAAAVHARTSKERTALIHALLETHKEAHRHPFDVAKNTAFLTAHAAVFDAMEPAGETTAEPPYPRCACGAHEWGPNTTRITDANGQEHYRQKCATQVKTSGDSHG
jgi:hypothetical protein